MPEMKREWTAANTAVDVALGEWRRKATNALMAANALAYPPAILLLIAGKGPKVTTFMLAAVIAVYLVIVFAALLRRIHHETRARAMLVTAYPLALLGNIAVPMGPFARALPIVLPMLAMVLLGRRAGRTATAASVAILLFAPLLHDAPALIGIVTAAPSGTPVPRGLLLTQGGGLAALLLGIMILLDRFHQLLVHSLAGLAREAARCSAAHHNLERELLERRRLEAELAQAGDEERRRLGIDIHDGVCQQLTGALLRSEAMARHLERGEQLAAGDLTALASLLEDTIDEAHAVARGLWPLETSPAALATALRRLAKQTQDAAAVVCRFVTTGDIHVADPMTARHLYRIAQEAASNAARHAKARRISVELHADDDTLLLHVEDDGVGMPDDCAQSGMGLRTMAYRARLLDGELTVGPGPAGGTRVSCRVPRAPSATSAHHTEEPDYVL
jgi:signal transduction histidine kinase